MVPSGTESISETDLVFRSFILIHLAEDRRAAHARPELAAEFAQAGEPVRAMANFPRETPF
jgi:hypothetical protein